MDVKHFGRGTLHAARCQVDEGCIYGSRVDETQLCGGVLVLSITLPQNLFCGF